MARGDIATVISANLGQYSTVDRQPADGVEEYCLDLGLKDYEGSAPLATPGVAFFSINGSDNGARMANGDNGQFSDVWFKVRPIATYTNYFRFMNSGGGAGDLTFAVIVVG